jgi:hypothetical protein
MPLLHFNANFREATKETPVIGKGFAVPVYFIANNILYKGEYCDNKCFYAYECLGTECLATADGLKFEGTGEVCEYWCYVHELRHGKAFIV